MKQIQILSGKAMIVEMPEGAINPHIHPGSNGLWYKYEGDKGGFSYKRCELPPGNWQIVGMLSEVTADDDIESAILAEGFTFENKEINPSERSYFSRERAEDDLVIWQQAQSRVLSRERCLLLRREG